MSSIIERTGALNKSNNSIKNRKRSMFSSGILETTNQESRNLGQSTELTNENLRDNPPLDKGSVPFRKSGTVVPKNKN